jgi:FtsP/CotA-like multicopper oxidase with cupredoxin domain
MTSDVAYRLTLSIILDLVDYLRVVPHLFYPMGTGDTQADWISITPASQNPDQKCFCYVFDIPSDHPPGTYWYHIHRHGSTAMQAWGGMVGYLLIGNATTPGSPDRELLAQGITRDEPLALWEWLIDPNKTVSGEPDTFIEPNFLDPNQQQVFLTNNEYSPRISMCVNETVHIRLLCAQTTTGSVLYILDETDTLVTFWVFASDGISYNKAYEKTFLVIGPGQREGVLVQFNRPGRYRLMQDILNDFQDTGEDLDGPTPAASFVVSSVRCVIPAKAIDLSSLVFTPGVKYNVSVEAVDRQVEITFMTQSALDKAPIPQFVIDGQLFDYRRSVDTVEANSSQQWTLTSNMDCTCTREFICMFRLLRLNLMNLYGLPLCARLFCVSDFHPFHIHLNPFQVVSVVSSNVIGMLPGNYSLADAVSETNMVPSLQWRDTVFIPPFGQTIVYQRFGEDNAFAGKTVYHCHFLDHEDQGMIAAFLIDNPNSSNNSQSSNTGSIPSTIIDNTSGAYVLRNIFSSPFRILLSSVVSLLIMYHTN